MALYVPNPDRGSVEDLVEELSRELAARYQAVEDELIREVAKRAVIDQRLAAELPVAAAGRGLTVAERRRQNRILAELAAHRALAVRELQAKAMALVEQLRNDDLARRVIETAATEGEAAAAAQLGFASRQAPAAAAVPVLGGQAAVSATTLTSTATQAVAALVLNLDSRLEELNKRITRYPQDAYQRIVSLYSPGTILGATTSRVQQEQAVQRFLAEGIPSFEDRAGRTWRIGSYAEMAGRTSVNRAFNDAAVWRMQQSSVYLVTIVRGLDSCRKCAEWAGKILSTDGTSGTVEVASPLGGTVTVNVAGTLDDARNGGWNHPNCRCRVAPYLAGVTVITDDSTYDEDAEKERAKQRDLERDIRQAKRREASAITDTDRARARADVREAQAAMRQFTSTTGRRRDSYREQLHFADGRGGSPRPAPGAMSGPRKPRPGLDIRIRRGTPLGDEVAVARSSIARVHTIPSTLPTVSVESAALRTGENGIYRGGRSVLQLNPKGPSPRLTFVHEVGHYLDHRLLGASTRNLESRMLTEEVTREWLAAVQGTDAYKTLAGMLDDMTLPRDVADHVRYLLQPAELWGRSYAQYVAVKSGDEVMAAEIAAYMDSLDAWTAARQWATTDFEPVTAAIDAVLRAKGVLK